MCRKLTTWNKTRNNKYVEIVKCGFGPLEDSEWLKCGYADEVRLLEKT